MFHFRVKIAFSVLILKSTMYYVSSKAKWNYLRADSVYFLTYLFFEKEEFPLLLGVSNKMSLIRNQNILALLNLVNPENY